MLWPLGRLALGFSTAMIAQCPSERRVAVDGVGPLAVTRAFLDRSPYRHVHLTLLAVPIGRNGKHQQSLFVRSQAC